MKTKRITLIVPEFTPRRKFQIKDYWMRNYSSGLQKKLSMVLSLVLTPKIKSTKSSHRFLKSVVGKNFTIKNAQW